MTDVIATFEVQYEQILDPQGKLVGELPAFAKSKEALLHLYHYMVLTRTFDTKAINLQRTGKMGTFGATTGQEGVAAAIGAAMRQEDVLVAAYREYAAQFQRGISMKDILNFWGGDERGNDWGAREDPPLPVPLATQLLHATGIAKAIQYRKEDRAVVTVCGDGATSEGDFYEAINVAGSWKLPVVFVINNNQWAISVPRDIQSGAQTLAQKGFAGGLPVKQVDGNDVIVVQKAIQDALAHARAGKGPMLIETLSYRLGDHTTADDASRYRDKAALDDAWEKEPIIRLKKYLMAEHGWTDADNDTLQAQCAADVDVAVQAYLSQTPQGPSSLFDYLYAELPAALNDQKDEVVALHGGQHV